jgi:sugar lactone lactonase YvrE
VVSRQIKVFGALLGVGAAVGVIPHLFRVSDGTPRQVVAAPAGTPFGWAAQTVAVAAAVSDPFGLAIDRMGTLYISDAGDNNRIRKMTAAGEVSTLAGGEEGFADGLEHAAFNTPSGLAIDEAGTLYVADTGNNAIRKITPQGAVITLAGDGVAGYRDGPARQARFNGPIGLAVGRAGEVYVADSYNDRIRMISPTGEVTTLAGEGGPGYRDGATATARFDTPCSVLVDAKGDLIVADTGNDALRVIDHTGQVTTLVRTKPDDEDQRFRRPVGLAATPDGFLYVGTLPRGRIFQVSPTGEMRGLTGVDIDYPKGDNEALRLVHPDGLAVAGDGSLFVADSSAHGLRKVIPRSDRPIPLVPPGSIERQKEETPWPVNPRSGFHEVVGTMGEVRGNDDGDSRDHFHAGIDVQANIGTPVQAIRAGKVGVPLASWRYDDLGEGLAVGPIAYIHMRVGRRADNTPIDPSRFTEVTDDSGRRRIRVKRGTRFAVGDVLGTVNRMYHVHVEFAPDGTNHNPLELNFAGLRDRSAPRIETIQVFARDGAELTKRRGGRLLIPSTAGDVSVVAGAYDQIDGDTARRRLGLYRIGYQILQANGTPATGFEEPRITLTFDQLPPDNETVKIVYAEGSGETVHGNPGTRFLYGVTNSLQGGHVTAGAWQAGTLPRGDYTIRIFAADYAGNVAIQGRDLPISLN